MRTILQFFGGINNIGGNKIVIIAANGKGVFLDFGYDFTIYKQYFNSFLKVRKSHILIDGIKIKSLPWPIETLSGIYRPDLYKEHRNEIEDFYHSEKLQDMPEELELDAEPIITEVLISHAHTDHIGDIKYLNKKIKLVGSSETKQIMEILDDISGSASIFNSIMSYKPHFQEKNSDDVKIGTNSRIASTKLVTNNRDFIELQSGIPINVANDGLQITFYETDHSIPGAGGFLIKDLQTGKKIVYTGDIRIHGPNSKKAIKFIQAAKKFNPHILITEGTRLTTDPNENEETLKSDVEIDGREYELPGEIDVLNTIIKFLKKIPTEDSKKLIFFDCAGRDFWRLGSFFRAATEIGRTLVIDTKMFILLKNLDPAGTKFGIKLDQIKIYLPRKGWGVYEGEDYTQSEAIKQLFRLNDNDWDDKFQELNKYAEEEHESNYKGKFDEFEKKIAEWELNGKEGKKPRKPPYTKFTTIKNPREALKFDPNFPQGINASKIHENQSYYLVFLPPYTINELFDIRPDPGAYFIHSKSGPFDDEGILEKKRHNNWRKMFKIGCNDNNFAQIHCSGHISENGLIEMIKEINPKKIFPVHSNNREMLSTLLENQFPIVFPERGVKYNLE
jgi:ribonuclease J